MISCCRISSDMTTGRHYDNGYWMMFGFKVIFFKKKNHLIFFLQHRYSVLIKKELNDPEKEIEFQNTLKHELLYLAGKNLLQWYTWKKNVSRNFWNLHPFSKSSRFLNWHQYSQTPKSLTCENTSSWEGLEPMTLNTNPQLGSTYLRAAH